MPDDPLRAGKVRRARERAARGEDEAGRPVLAFVGANAPDDASEDREYERVRMWRAFDRDPRAFVRLPNGRKRYCQPSE